MNVEPLRLPVSLAVGIAIALSLAWPSTSLRAADLVGMRSYVAQPDPDLAELERTGAASRERRDQARAQLRALVELAIARSASLRELQAGVRASQQEIREAAGARLPQANVDVASRWSEVPESATATPLRGQPYYVLSASLPVYDFGRIGAQIDSRRATALAHEERLRAAHESLAGEVALAAIEVARCRAQMRVTEAYLLRMGSLSRLLEDLLAVDPGRAGELTQVRTRLLQAQLQRSALESRLREGELVLNRLLGRSDIVVDDILAAYDELPALDDALVYVASHPSLRQLSAESDAQESTARSVAAARFPQVSAVAGRTPINAGVTTQYQTYAGLSVSVPLYRGGSDIAAQRAAVERARALDERRAQVAIDIETRIRTQHQVVTAQRVRATEFVVLLRASDRIRLDFFEQWAQLGRRSLFELLSAESDHHSMRLAHLNAVYDAYVAISRIRAESATTAAWLKL